MNKKYLFLSESTLKIIAIILMTIDHVSLFLLPSNSDLQIALRAIGRLSMPIFIFMNIEGIYHTRNIWKYFLRLFVLGTIIDIVGIISKYGPGNILIDFSMYTIIFYFLKQKNIKSLISIFPIAFLVLSDLQISVFGIQFFNSDYGTYGLIFALFIFLAKEISFYVCKNQANIMQIDQDYFLEEKLQGTYNVAASIAIFIATALFYVIYRIDYTLPILPGTIAIQSWCFFSAVFILFYNGKRGYNKPWFKYGSSASLINFIFNSFSNISIFIYKNKL